MRINTVEEEMRYDTPFFAVEAGRPVQVVLHNEDLMPHNFVIVENGKHMDIGNAALTLPPDRLDGKGRAYLPKDFPIRDATKLLEPGQKEKLQIPAINEEGEHEYVCTFPGHAAIMWGKLIVTKDVDAYLAAHPQ